MTDIQQLIHDGRELLDKATPGPWSKKSFGIPIIPDDRKLKWTDSDIVDGWIRNKDATLIAWSRNNLPALLDRLEAAQKENERLRADLTQALLSKGLDDIREGRLEAFDPSQEAELVALRRVADAADRLAFLVEENPAYRDDAFALQDMLAALSASTEGE